MKSALTDFQTQVLVALVDGYLAREGMKDRIRALNEWEIARRSGITDISYAGYLEHPTRDKVAGALMALQRLGFVAVWERGAKYDTFVPTTGGTLLVGADQSSEGEQRSAETAAAPLTTSGAEADRIVERLDEIIRLLRSLESKLGG